MCVVPLVFLRPIHSKCLRAAACGVRKTTWRSCSTQFTLTPFDGAKPPPCAWCVRDRGVRGRILNVESQAVKRTIAIQSAIQSAIPVEICIESVGAIQSAVRHHQSVPGFAAAHGRHDPAAVRIVLQAHRLQSLVQVSGVHTVPPTAAASTSASASASATAAVAARG
jgi:hypothetical protein